MNILVLAAGEQATSAARGAYPLWLAEIAGTTVLERLIRSFEGLAPSQYIFAFRRSDLLAYHVGDIAKLISPGCSVIEINRDTQGAACTALLAVSAINEDAELIITSVTDVIDVALVEVIESFRAKRADAGILVFDSLHPRYSYVRCNAQGEVIEAAEKRPISRSASAGLYWFARAGDFFDATKSMILKDAAVQGQFFICPSLNELILQGKRVATYSIASEQYHPIKAPQQVDTFEQTLLSEATT